MARDIRQAFAAQSRMSRDRFLASLKDARTAQAAVLQQCITPNAETVFGKEHSFATISDLDAYRKAVPIRSYDELEPWIDRAGDGEPSVLTREAPVRFWKTTGTTSKSKKIPITPAAAMRVTESFLALQGTWFSYWPELNERADTMVFSHISPKSIKDRLKGGAPWCSNSEAPIEVRAGHEGFIAPWMLPLQAVAEDDAERLYFLLTYAALHDLYAFFCLHPSRLQTIASVLETSWQKLVREIHEGTILGKKMRDARPDRARALEEIGSKQGFLLPKDIWPNLRFVSSWSGSYIGRHLPLMQRAFSPEFLAMPSIASECFMTMTIDKDRTGHPLNIRGGIFEFIPSGEPVKADTPTLMFDELVEGATYEMVITTLGGLYRYAISDIFRVTGFVHDVPRLEYVGRRAVSDLTGEKLAEEQVSEVVKATLAKHAVDIVNFTLCGIIDDSPGSARRPHYVLVLETAASGAGKIDVEAIAKSLDTGFKEANSRYELKRNFNDLDSAVVEVAAPGTFARYRELLIQRGMPAGQLKDKVLHPIGSPVLADLRRSG